jgi:acyl carrier protein
MTTVDQIRGHVVQAIRRVFSDSGRDVPDIQDDSVFGTAIKLDSLDFAVVVVQLEQALGVDPFRKGARPVQTVGELIQLYADESSSAC